MKCHFIDKSMILIIVIYSLTISVLGYIKAKEIVAETDWNRMRHKCYDALDQADRIVYDFWCMPYPEWKEEKNEEKVSRR